MKQAYVLVILSLIYSDVALSANNRKVTTGNSCVKIRKCQSDFNQALVKEKENTFSCQREKSCAQLSDEESQICFENCRSGEDLVRSQIDDCISDAKAKHGTCDNEE